MVNSRVLFEQILAAHTLVAMHGMIPSLSEFQRGLSQRIKLFYRSLQATDYTPEEIDALRRLICFVVDKQAACCLEAQGISWCGYELEHIFYGYNSSSLLDLQHTQTLLNSKNAEIVHYALQLISLSPIRIPSEKMRLPQQSLTTHPTPLAAITSPDSLGSTKASEISSQPKGRRKGIWTPLFIQLSLAILLLAMIWSGCSYFLTDGM